MSAPIITCTQMQLAFNAWQLAKSAFHLDQASLDPTPEFRAWWDAGHAFASLRDCCWAAFVAARPPVEPIHGAQHHFDAWWQEILDTQPVTAP